MAEAQGIQRHVECGNCRQRVDVSRYIVAAPENASLPSVHLRPENGFSGAVRCPDCQHYTIYRR